MHGNQVKARRRAVSWWEWVLLAVTAWTGIAACLVSVGVRRAQEREARQDQAVAAMRRYVEVRRHDRESAELTRTQAEVIAAADERIRVADYSGGIGILVTAPNQADPEVVGRLHDCRLVRDVVRRQWGEATPQNRE